MLKRSVRLTAALSMAALMLSPLAAQATPSGSNNQIVAACNDASSNPALCKYDANGSNKTVLVATSGGANYQVFGMSTDGTKVLLGVGTGAPDPQLYLLVPQTGTLTNMGLAVQGAAITPDGAKMVVSEVDGSGNDSLVAMNLDKTSPVTLAAAVASHLYRTVVISPDGTTVAYSDQNVSVPTITSTVNTAAITGGSSTNHSANLTNGGVVLDWNPNGLSLLVTDGVDSSAVPTGVPVASLVLSSNVVTDLITPSSNHSIDSAVYSPDGTKLLYDLSDNLNTTDAVFTAASNGTGSAALAGIITGMVGRGAVLAWSATNMGTTVQANLAGVPTGSPAPTAGLPKAGGISASLPIALAIAGLLGAAGIEVARRVRRRA